MSSEGQVSPSDGESPYGKSPQGFGCVGSFGLSHEELEGKNDAGFVDVDVLEGSISPASSRFAAFLDPIQEMPRNSSAQLQKLTEAYVLFNSLLDRRVSLSGASSQGELRLEDALDLVKVAVERVARQPSTTDQKLVTAAKATKCVIEQLENYAKLVDDMERRENELRKAQQELRKRANMAEIQANLLFDRLKAVESDESRIDTEESEAKGGIVEEIQRKEEKISALQKELRRLQSKKVIEELASSRELREVDVKELRKDRSGSARSPLKQLAVPESLSKSRTFLCQSCGLAFQSAATVPPLFQEDRKPSATSQPSEKKVLSIYSPSPVAVKPSVNCSSRTDRCYCCPAF